MVVAWNTAATRVKNQAEVEATHETLQLAKPIAQSDYIAMRNAYSSQFGELEDKHIPAKEYIEKKLCELETGEFRAEPLTEVVSRDEVDPDVLVTTWNAKGQLSVKKGGSTTSIMIKLKHPGRPELKDVQMTLFEKYKEYLLGDYCYGLRAGDDAGGMIPPWTLVLLRACYPKACLQAHG